MYGNALLVAEEAEAILTAQGHKATVFEDPELSDWQVYQDKYVLVVTSTTGQGDLPDSIVPLFQGSKIISVSSQICITESLGWATAATLISAMVANSLMRCCRSKAHRVGEMLLIDASEHPEPESESNPGSKTGEPCSNNLSPVRAYNPI